MVCTQRTSSFNQVKPFSVHKSFRIIWSLKASERIWVGFPELKAFPTASSSSALRSKPLQCNVKEVVQKQINTYQQSLCQVEALWLCSPILVGSFLDTGKTWHANTSTKSLVTLKTVLDKQILSLVLPTPKLLTPQVDGPPYTHTFTSQNKQRKKCSAKS